MMRACVNAFFHFIVNCQLSILPSSTPRGGTFQITQSPRKREKVLLLRRQMEKAGMRLSFSFIHPWPTVRTPPPTSHPMHFARLMA
jgi:hypothetical protein